MRIAVIGPTHPYKGGIAHHTTVLAHRLAAQGHDVRLESWARQYPALLYPGEQRAAAVEMEPFGRVSYPLAWNRPDSWLALGRRLRREVDAAVLVVTTPVQVPAQLTVLRALGGTVATLALCHNVLPHEPQRWDAALMRALLRRVDAVLVHTEAQRGVAARLGAGAVAVAPLAPHLPGSPPVRPDPDGPVRRRLLFFGIVRPYKGLDVLVRALATGPADVSLTVAGEFWSGEEETLRLIAEQGLTRRVTLQAGYVPATALPELFGAADALVLPYRASTATQMAFVGHAHGLPVVATRTGSFSEQVRDGVDGLLCEPDDVDGLARALRHLYEPGVLHRLRRGIEPPDETTGWQRYAEVLVAALDQVQRSRVKSGTRSRR